MNCWQCSAITEIDAAFCTECNSIQPPQTDRTHFEYLGVPNHFAQNADELSQRHRSLQRTFHPDRFVSRDARQRRLSLEHATRLNDAYRILRDPCKRAEYMLSLRGCDINHEDTQIRLAPMFLMEIIELREAIEELSGSDTHVERSIIERDVALRFEETLSQLGQGLDGETVSVDTMAQWAAQLKYLKRIIDEIHEGDNQR